MSSSRWPHRLRRRVTRTWICSRMWAISSLVGAGKGLRTGAAPGAGGLKTPSSTREWKCTLAFKGRTEPRDGGDGAALGIGDSLAERGALQPGEHGADEHRPAPRRSVWRRRRADSEARRAKTAPSRAGIRHARQRRPPAGPLSQARSGSNAAPPKPWRPLARAYCLRPPPKCPGPGNPPNHRGHRAKYTTALLLTARPRSG